MIESFNPDYASWKKACRERELCEKKEQQLKQIRNILIVATVSLSVVLTLMKILFHSGPLSGKLLLGVLAIGVGIAFITWFLVKSASAKTEKALNNECRIVSGLFREVAQNGNRY